MKKYLALMRVKHYIKNLLIFFPALLTLQLRNAAVVWTVAVGFALFCFAASIVYIVNDILDVEADRAHPLKCGRPLASGAVSLCSAWMLVATLAGAELILWGLAGFDVRCILWPAVYLALNIFYSICLKRIPLLDVLILVSDYVLRLWYGAILAGTIVSNWMFLTVMSAAFFMGFGKRRNEFLKYGVSMRESLKGYTEKFLDKAMQITLTSSIVFYSLMCADVNTEVARAGVNMLWTTPFIIVICLRYLMLVEKESSDGDPVSVIMGDRTLILLCFGYIMAVGVSLYFR